MIVARYGTALLFGQEEYPLPGPARSEVIEIGGELVTGGIERRLRLERAYLKLRLFLQV